MRKKILISLVCFLIVFTATFGQEQFKNGYIITNEKDTLHGQILSEIDSKLAFKISFRDEASGSEVTSYLVSDLVGFGFNNGRTFERITLRKPESDTTSVFVKKVLTGKIDLWIWRNSNDEPDILLKNNSNQKFVHLTKVDDRPTTEDGKKYTQPNYKFIGLLKHVTDNELKPTSRKKDLKYSERNITGQILSINQKYEEQIPTRSYKEELAFSYDISIGIPFQLDPKSTELKVGVIRRKTRVEKNTNVSTIRGITYYGWHEHGGYDNSIENGTSNHRWQLINILPLGLHFQGKHKTIKPYAYTGFGLAILALSDYQIVDSKNTGSKTSFLPYPTVYIGAGLKIKVGSNYLLAEVTPSIWNSTISLGLGF
jgi:hypothetical protein